MNWKVLPTTWSADLFFPVSLSSHSLTARRPFSQIGSPLWKYCAIVSATRSKKVTSMKVACSSQSPLAAFFRSFTARRSFVTVIPLRA